MQVPRLRLRVQTDVKHNKEFMPTVADHVSNILPFIPLWHSLTVCEEESATVVTAMMTGDLAHPAPTLTKSVTVVKVKSATLWGLSFIPKCPLMDEGKPPHTLTAAP